jgi:hypothetical protein
MLAVGAIVGVMVGTIVGAIVGAIVPVGVIVPVGAIVLGAIIGASRVGVMVIASASEVGEFEGMLTVGLPILHPILHSILASLLEVMFIAAGTTSSPELVKYTIIAPITTPNTNVNTPKTRNNFWRFADDSV